MPDPRFPIGPFKPHSSIDAPLRSTLIGQIREAPARLREAVKDASEEILETPYRPGGWTVRQVVHHLADSHIHAYIRSKFIVAEDEPTVKPYDQSVWAELHDARRAPIGLSLALLDSVHDRWVRFLESLHPSDFSRKFHHPEHGDDRLDGLVDLYAWHGRHHVAQIDSLRGKR
jgi:uncharacterized damage-inducible protein DinB